jgi:hypothetical protein
MSFSFKRLFQNPEWFGFYLLVFDRLSLNDVYDTLWLHLSKQAIHRRPGSDAGTRSL